MQTHRIEFGRRGQSVMRAGLLLLLCAPLLLEPSPALAQRDDSAEYKLKMAFLFHLAEFVQWPQEAFKDLDAPLVMCVAGQDPFQGEIEQSLRGRTVEGHPVQLKRLKPDDDMKDCHIVFVRAGERATP